MREGGKSKMSTEAKVDKIELLKLFYEDWKFRQENLWRKFTKFFVIIFFTSTLPVSISVFNDARLPELDFAIFIFPVSGIFLTIFLLWYCLSESVRIKAVDDKIQDIICECFGAKYTKCGMKSVFKDKKEAHPLFCMRMAVWVPITLSIIELIVAFLMLLLIITQKV